MSAIVVVTAVLMLSFVTALCFSGLRLARCSDCALLGGVLPARSPRRCRRCVAGILAYPPSFLGGLFVRPAVARVKERRRPRS